MTEAGESPSQNAGGGADAVAPTAAATAVAKGVEEFDAVAAAPPGQLGLAPDPGTESYDASRWLDQTRAKLAFRLVWVLVGVLVAGVALLATLRWTHVNQEGDVASTFTLVFSSMVTLVSAATGFYFGQQTITSASTRKP